MADKLQRRELQRPARKMERIQRPPRGMQWPRFDAMFDPDDIDPFDGMPMTGDPEQDNATENAIIERDFLDNVRVEGDPYRTAVDPEFYFVVCFQSREQKKCLSRYIRHWQGGRRR